MKRHLLTALAVLVPFAALVAFGFSLLKDPPPLMLPPETVRYQPPVLPPEPEPMRPPPPSRPLAPPLPTTVQVVPPAPPAAPPPEVKPPELSPEAKRMPIIAAVEPLIQQCFRDVMARVEEPLKVTVAFNTTTDGKFENAVLKRISWPDPNLTACILDSFDDAHFVPSGFALKRQTYTFTFSFAAPDAGP